MSDEQKDGVSRRDFLRGGLRGAALVVFGGLAGSVIARELQQTEYVWQIDPWKCIWCGKCATACVLTPSAVKCLRDMPVCGYCEICTGYNHLQRLDDDEAAENQLCPTQAITRELIEYPYYEYLVDEDKCIGCAKCAEGCTLFGNGSMYMQIKHDICVDCNECAIAVACPSDAIVRVPIARPYLLKGGDVREIIENGKRVGFELIGSPPWTEDESKAGEYRK
ncbi:MAG: ferredoxin [Planctomycetota bacterium]